MLSKLSFELGAKALAGFEDVQVVKLSNPWGQWKFRLDLEDNGLSKGLFRVLSG